MDDQDVEDRRRERNLRRRALQRYRRRVGYLEQIGERDPALHATLLELRNSNPQGFRKALQRAARSLGLHELFEYTEREPEATAQGEARVPPAADASRWVDRGKKR